MHVKFIFHYVTVMCSLRIHTFIHWGIVCGEYVKSKLKNSNITVKKTPKMQPYEWNKVKPVSDGMYGGSMCMVSIKEGSTGV